MLVRRLLVACAAIATLFATSLVPAQADTVTDPYSAPGVHLINDRYWRTTCSMYSSTVVRCTTDIYGTKVFTEDGRWYKQNDWVFNNLTYLPSPRADWTYNNLGKTMSWTADDGRRWESECDTPATGTGACRQYVYADVASESGGVVKQQNLRVFNSLVKFQTSTVAWVKTIPAAVPARSDVPVATTPVPLRTAAKPSTPVVTKPTTVSQEQAVRKAQSYLDVLHFSRTGLIGQLEFEGFSNADAVFAVDSLAVNWNAQAAGKAQDYLDVLAFSRQGLIEQLEFEGFTHAQAVYGVDSVGL